MSSNSSENWFEKNPFKSIVIHTITVAAAVSAVLYFVVDENRINGVKSQLEKSKAEVEEAKTMGEQYEAKAEFLQEQNAKLEAQNQKYIRWLEQQPGTMPFFETAISNLEARILVMSKSAATNVATVPGLYNFQSELLSCGESFIDPKTGAIIGMTQVTVTNTADATIVLPGKPKPLKEPQAKAGDSWDYEFSGKKYRLTLFQIAFITGKFRAVVNERNE